MAFHERRLACALYQGLVLLPRHECKGLRALLGSLRQALEETLAKAKLSTNVRVPELSKSAVAVDALPGQKYCGQKQESLRME